MKLVFISFVIFCSLEVLAFGGTSSDTLLPGQSLSYDQTLVSNNGLYQLGFLNGYYLSIGIETTNNIVWQLPITDVMPSSHPLLYLNLTEDGDLILGDKKNLDEFITSVSSSKPVSSNLVLLDTGNLVLRDSKNSSRIFWQSFDYPSDTWLPGARLGFNLSLSSNGYSLKIDPSTTRGFIIQNDFSSSAYRGVFPSWMDIREDGNHFITFYDTKEYSHLYVSLNSWQVYIIQWVNESSISHNISKNKSTISTTELWVAPINRCNLNSSCGPYALCEYNEYYDDISCTCPFGFQPASSQGYCSRNVSLDCNISEHTHYVDSFYSIDNINKFPDDRDQSLAVRAEAECEAFCLGNCSCTAYSYNNDKCGLWFGELFSTNIRSDGRGGEILNIRIRNMVSKHKTRFHWRGGKDRIVIMIILVIVVVSAAGSVMFWLYRRAIFRNQSKVNNLVLYSYAQLKSITTKFSEKLGEGGFGSVFKGKLSDSSLVAVKKLKTVCYEEKQFRSEIQTIGIIQHVNLVRLLGFCAEGTKRLLVYEFMPNGSLNSHIFSKNSEFLTWKTRYEIVVGIARGLSYLHEECQDCIIHCDIKPENILLDEHYCPKIADFGMAKLLGRDFSRALTTMRGTIGYLAPEWISGQPITQKADVYSFGMMLFEIISGRRNSAKLKNRECTYFPLYAAIKINQDKALCLLDGKLDGNGNTEEINKACKVACWCIQDFEDDRPSMRQIVQMLEGIVKIDIPPIPRSLENLVDFPTDSSYFESY